MKLLTVFKDEFDSLELKAELTRDDLRQLDEALSILKMAANPRSLAPTQSVIGYKVKNIGSQPIPVTRMTATPDHFTSQASLNPGQSMCLSRAEMAILASKPEIGCTFANGKLVNASYRTNATLYEFLTRCYFNFNSLDTSDCNRYELANPANKFGVNSPNIKLDVRKLESPDIVNTYFVNHQVLAPFQTKREEQRLQETAQQAQRMQEKIQQSGLFGAFKR